MKESWRDSNCARWRSYFRISFPANPKEGKSVNASRSWMTCKYFLWCDDGVGAHSSVAELHWSTHNFSILQPWNVHVRSFDNFEASQELSPVMFVFWGEGMDDTTPRFSEEGWLIPFPFNFLPDFWTRFWTVESNLILYYCNVVLHDTSVYSTDICWASFEGCNMLQHMKNT